jgi:hypothetical protein
VLVLRSHGVQLVVAGGNGILGNGEVEPNIGWWLVMKDGDVVTG